MVEYSIHPRHSRYGTGKKKNTCNPPCRGKYGKGKRLRKASAELNRRIVDYSATLDRVPANMRGSFRKPGSMKA